MEHGTKHHSYSVLNATHQHTINVPNVPETITLYSNWDDVTVINGDITNAEARIALTSGLCGDLAMALNDLDGRDIYFLSYHTGMSEESLYEAHGQDPESIHDYVFHAVASSQHENAYLDGNGYQTEDELRNFYGDDIAVIRGTYEMAVSYASHQNNVEAFAHTLLALDETKTGYPAEQSWG